MHLIAYFELERSTDYEGGDHIQRKTPILGLGRHLAFSPMYSLPITRHTVGRDQGPLELSQHHCLVCHVRRDDDRIYSCAKVQGWVCEYPTAYIHESQRIWRDDLLVLLGWQYCCYSVLCMPSHALFIGILILI